MRRLQLLKQDFKLEKEGSGGQKRRANELRILIKTVGCRAECIVMTVVLEISEKPTGKR